MSINQITIKVKLFKNGSMYSDANSGVTIRGDEEVEVPFTPNIQRAIKERILIRVKDKED